MPTNSAARDALVELAVGQHGLFTAEQALAAGYRYQAQHYHVHTGSWQRVLRGVYRIASWPTTPLEEPTRWFLWAQGDAVISHDSAAGVHGMGTLEPNAVHLTLRPGSRRVPPDAGEFPKGALAIPPIIHHASLAPADVRAAQGFVVTSPLRTVLDLARSGIDASHLAQCIDDGLRLQLLDRRQLDTALERADPVAGSILAAALDDVRRATPGVSRA